MNLDRKNYVFYFINTTRFGGAEIAVLRLINNLRASLIPVIFTNNYNILSKYIQCEAIIITDIKFRNLNKNDFFLFNFVNQIKLFFYSFKFTSKVLTVLRKKNNACIHIHSLQHGALLLPLIFMNKLFSSPFPVIYHIHEIRNYRLSEKILHTVIKILANINIVVSHAVGTKNYRSNSICIYNGISIKSNKMSLSKKIINKQFTIGVIANLVDGKGHLDILNEISNSDCLENNIKFYFIGKLSKNSDSYTKILRNKIKLYDKESLVCTGWLDDLDNMYSKLDLVLSPTKCELGEACSNVLIESLVRNLVVLCSDVGGNKEIIQDMKNGFMFECNNYKDMWKKILFIKNNPSIAKAISKNGFNYVKHKFNINSMIQAYEEVLKSI